VVEGEFRPLTPDERAVILNNATALVDGFRSAIPGWRCVGSPVEYDEEAPPLLPTRVNFDVVVGPAEDGSGGATVYVAVSAVGKQYGYRIATVPQQLLNADEGSALSGVVNGLLNDLLPRLSPCTPKVKVKAKTKLSHQDVEMEASQEGETRLALIEDGSFSGTIPTAVSERGRAGSSCTISGDYTAPMDVSGQFQDDDGTLKFTRMQLHGMGGTATSTCTFGQSTQSMTAAIPSAPGTDAAAESDIRIPLQDGARLEVPVHPIGPGITYEFTIDLTYEGEGEGVAAVAAIER
jgi:hypothetical protein